MLHEMDDTARGCERTADVFGRNRDQTVAPDVLRAWSARLPRRAGHTGDGTDIGDSSTIVNASRQPVPGTR